MKTIDVRRSIRNFVEKEVEQEKIEKVIRAGMQAPSAHNQQAWEFIVVNDNNKKQALSEISPYAKPAKLAGVDLILAINKDNLKIEELIDQDMGACTQNVLLEVVEQGLGAVWMGVKPGKERMDLISDILELPENIIPFGLVAIGYSEQENKFIDRFDESKIHYNKY